MKTCALIIAGICSMAFVSLCGNPETAVPQRIVSLSPAITEQIFILGAGDRIAGCTSYCVRPEEAKNKEKVGSVVESNLEKIVSLKPDIVFASSLTKPGTVSKLEEMGLKVIVIKSPKSFDSFFKQFIAVGELIGEKEKAERIAAESRASLERIRKVCGTAGTAPSVLFQIGANPVFLAGNEYFINDFILFAGGKNALGDRKSGVYSREAIFELNPDLILIATMGLVGETEKEDWLKFKSLSASESGRIFICDSTSYCSPNPIDIAKTVAETATLFFPEKKTEIIKSLSDGLE